MDCLLSMSESDAGDLHATMLTMQRAARTFTEARDPLNRVRNARGDDPIVGLAALLAIENADKGVQKGCQDKKIWKRQSQEHDWKERTNVKGQGQVKRGPYVASFVTSLATIAETVHHVGKGKARCDSSHLLGFSGFALASMFIKVPMSSGFTSFSMASLWSDCFSGFQGLEAIGDAHRASGTKDSFEIDTASEKQISYTRTGLLTVVGAHSGVALDLPPRWKAHATPSGTLGKAEANGVVCLPDSQTCSVSCANLLDDAKVFFVVQLLKRVVTSCRHHTGMDLLCADFHRRQFVKMSWSWTDPLPLGVLDHVLTSVLELCIIVGARSASCLLSIQTCVPHAMTSLWPLFS